MRVSLPEVERLETDKHAHKYRGFRWLSAANGVGFDGGYWSDEGATVADRGGGVDPAISARKAR
jgi:hypothetical protein